MTPLSTWKREGVHRGTRHLQAAEPRRQERYAAARGDPDASSTPDKVRAQHINTWVPPPPAACPQLPPTPTPPKGFFINGFFIVVARSLNVQNPLLVRQAQWQWRPTREGRARKGRGAGRCGGRATGRGAGLCLRGSGSARPSLHAITAAAAVFVQLALRWGRNWAAQWHSARAMGKRFRGCRAKRLYVHTTSLRVLKGAPGVGKGGAHS